jgi:PKHD-type hydroxylase
MPPSRELHVLDEEDLPMLVSVPEVLTAAEVGECRGVLDAAEWVDGSVTAGFESIEVKHNRQIPVDSDAARQLGRVVLDALDRNLLFNAAALPARIFPPRFNRYEESDSFGDHVDNAIRQVGASGQHVRLDISATLFLSAVDEYDGGELVIDDTYGPRAVKLPAGHMVLYPSTSLHRVLPVTRGARIASFFWIQSLVREDAQRSLLFELDMAILELREQMGDAEPIVALTGVYHNLLRRWASV